MGWVGTTKGYVLKIVANSASISTKPKYPWLSLSKLVSIELAFTYNSVFRCFNNLCIGNSLISVGVLCLM